MKTLIQAESGIDPELPIVLTEAGTDSVVLSALVRQAIPVLEDPTSIPPNVRQSLVGQMREALALVTQSNEFADINDHADLRVDMNLASHLGPESEQ